MLYRCMDSFKNYMVGFGKAAVVYVADIDSRGVGIGVAESTGDDGVVTDTAGRMPSVRW